ncbi:hypothetical protein FALBO_6728 [Fusarium albosuccineum]|uniref:Uncharacterized protein n=1 Tax=Fusarium albosuccineum TaxID=1237068 RepID=A0A8H4LE86_9HYPO|nr:hypothetical protein FALBO_6728 [Fusarium albosuccineum]
MLHVEPQGFDDRACDEHGRLPLDCRCQPDDPDAPGSPVSKVRASTARRRLALTSKPVNNHLPETTSFRLSPAALKTPSAPLSTPLSPSLAPPPVAAPPTSARKRDSGFHVEPGSPRLQSPLRHSVTFSNDIDFETESRFQSPSTGHVRSDYFFDMAFTGDKRATVPRSRPSLPAVAEETPRNRFPAWFSRAAAPTPSTSSPSVASETRARSASSASKTTSPLSRFNFFGSTSTPTTPVSGYQNDELMNVDIEKGLFPNGTPVEGTAFSPSAFKNLQMNATGMLNKFQVAYQQRSIELQELQVEHNTDASSKSEAEIKIQQLEKQLEEQARQAADRDAFIEHLLNQLADAKDRADLEAEREKELATSAASTVSEDLGLDEDRQRRWRKSTSTSSDDDSVDEASVFSRSRSPTIATSISEFSPVTTPIAQSKPIILEPPRANRTGNQMNPLQKLFKGITPDAPKSAATDSCRNCQGQEASIAWDTVNLLKDENRGLKQRVEELETAVEGALDVVNGLVL